jgi:alpha-L-rhamnosidase
VWVPNIASALFHSWAAYFTRGQIKSQDCCGPCAPALAYQSLVVRTTKSANYTTQFSWSAFRYVQVSALPPGWEIKVEARPLMTNLQWTTAFESSNELLNDIFEMCQNTHASNMMGIQSDCPHRERFGYTGDALATLPVSLAFFDGASFYEKRLYDVLDSLRPNGGVTVRDMPCAACGHVFFMLASHRHHGSIGNGAFCGHSIQWSWG